MDENLLPDWMNGQYIRKMPIAELVKLVKPYLTSYSLEEYSQEKLERIVDAVKEPLVTLNEITESVSYFFGNDVVIDEKIQADVLDLEESQIVLKEFAKLNLSYDNMDELHNQLGDFRKQMKADNNLKPKQTMWAIRAAVTGRVQGADIAEVISILGSEKVDLRVSKAIK